MCLVAQEYISSEVRLFEYRPPSLMYPLRLTHEHFNQAAVSLFSLLSPRSFSELYSLLSTDCERRAAAEPLSDLRLQTPLEEQRVKLETLKEHLSQAEQAERNGIHNSFYNLKVLV